VQVVVQAVPAMAPEESSMALLQKMAELLLRRTDQPEHWRCRSLPPHFDPPAARDGEVPSSTTRKRIRYIARERTLNTPLTFLGCAAETVTGCGPVCRAKKLCLTCGCRGMVWCASGLCREGMKTFHKRRGDRTLWRWEGPEEPCASKGCEGSKDYQYLSSVGAVLMTKDKFYLEEVTIWVIMPIFHAITSGSRKRVRDINL